MVYVLIPHNCRKGEVNSFKEVLTSYGILIHKVTVSYEATDDGASLSPGFPLIESGISLRRNCSSLKEIEAGHRRTVLTQLESL